MRKLVVSLALIAAFSAFAPPSSHAANPLTFQQLCDGALETIQGFYAVKSTQMGIHAYDHRFTDYSPGSVKEMVKKLSDFEKKFYNFDPGSLSAHDKINYQLVKSNVDIALLDLKRIQWYKKSPQLYVDEAIDGIYFLFLSQDAPLSERMVSIMNRMKAVPALFATARANLNKPPAIYIESARSTLESGLQFYQDVAGELMNKFPDRADEISRAATQAREAMSDFLDYLSNLPPGPETSFAIGKENFDYKLSHEYFLDYDSDSLLRIGEALLAEADQACRKYEEYVNNNHQNGTDSVFVPTSFNKQDILDYYAWEVNQLKIFLELNGIVSVPANIGSVEIVETPPFLRTLVGGIAYQPAAPFDSVQTGYFYVRPIPDDLDRAQLEARYRYVYRRGFKGFAVHEAYPGHHLQMQLAGQNPDPIRKWQYNYMLIEGWGLYCEEMMYNAGLYGAENPTQWLQILRGVRFRAARIVADVKLHTGRMTYNECVEWLCKVLEVTTDADREYFRSEVRRYTLTPTIQMCYLTGKQDIMALLKAAQTRDGEKFSLRDFHDRILAEGTIPTALLWDIMELK